MEIEATDIPVSTEAGLGGAEAARAFLDAPATTAAETPPAAPAAPETPAAEEAATPPAAEGETPPEAVETPPPAAPPAEADIAARIERAVELQTRHREELQAERAKREALEARLVAFERARSGNVQGLVELMKAAGWDADSFVEALMANDPKKPEVVRHNQLEARFEEQRQEIERLRAEQTAREQERTIAEFKRGVVTQLTARSAEFPHLTAMFDGPEVADAVVQEMRRLYQDNGGTKQPTAFDAAASLEAQLSARVKRVKGSVSGAKVEADPPKVTPPATATQPKTITNDLTASPDAAFEPKTEEERLAKAAEVLRKSELGFT